MAQVLGYKSRLVADFETTFGEDPVSPAGIVLPFNSFGLKSRRAKRSAQTITGTRNPVKPVDGNLEDSGEAVIPVDSTCFGYWLKAMFGAPTTTGAAAPYAHEFTVGDSMPSMIHEIRFSDKTGVITYSKHSGVKISNFSMSIGGDDELTARIGLEAAGETLSGTAYDATPDTPSLSRLQNFQATITEGGAELAKCAATDFSFNFGLATDHYQIGGEGIRADLPEGILEVSGNVTTLFQSTDLLDKAVASTETSLVISFTSGTDELEFAFNEIQFERNTPAVEGPQGVMLSLPFVAYMDDDAAASVVVVTLTNSISSYA